MKKNVRKATSIALSLSMIAASMAAVSALSGQNVSAEETWSKYDAGVTTLGTRAINPPIAPASAADPWSGDYVYYGKYNGTPVKYRVLDPNCRDFKNTAETEVLETLFLDCDTSLTNGIFNTMSGNTSYGWQSSELKKWMNGSQFLENPNVFSYLERAAIPKILRRYDQQFSADYTLISLTNDESVFALNIEDANNTDYGYSIAHSPTSNREKLLFGSSEKSRWWLRSRITKPTTEDGKKIYKVAMIALDGAYYAQPVNDTFGYSPAFNVLQDDIIFASKINPDNTANFGNEYKLTLKDPNFGIDVTSGYSLSADVTADGTTITVPYTVTDTDADFDPDTVSVLIKDQNGAIISYAPLSGDYAAAGKGTFKLPDDLSLADWGRDYNVYILAEAVNEQLETDYASAMTEILTPDEVHYGITVSDTTNGEVTADKYSAVENDTVTLTATPDGGYTVKSVSVNYGDNSEVTVNAQQNGTYTFDMPAAYVTVSAEFGYADNIGARLEGYSLSLEGDIGVNFYMSLDDSVLNDDSAYMLFTLPDNKTQTVYVNDVKNDPQKQDVVNGKHYYIFKCNVAAKEMNDTIHAKIVTTQDGVTRETDPPYEYSVKEYADYIIAHPADFPEGAKDVAQSMLDYGAAAQTYFGSDKALVSPDYHDRINNVTISMYGFTDNTPDDIVFEGATLTMISETTLSLYFNTDKELEFSTDRSYTVEKATVRLGGVRYKVARIRGIKAEDLEKYITLTVSYGEGETCTVEYSPLTYCYRALNGGTTEENLPDLCRAIYLYWQAADIYYDLHH